MGDKEIKTVPNYVKFAFGGSAGMLATCFVQPLDLIKNRMQLAGQGGAKERTTTLTVLKSIVKNEGVFTLYNGLSAGLMRQATYTTTRLGIYTWLFENFSKDGVPPGFATKAALGMAAGVCGAFVDYTTPLTFDQTGSTPMTTFLSFMDFNHLQPIALLMYCQGGGVDAPVARCTPAEVALIRMTADGRLPLNERRNYKSVFDALFRIYREEGLLTLWRGAVPTMGRAMVVNAAQLASYSQAKQSLVKTGYFHEGIFLHFLASMISGLVTTTASMPVDIAKTRIQNMKTIDGKPEFKGPLDVLGKILKNEGVFALWKGFFPYYFRLGPHTVLTFIFLEQMNGSYNKFILKQEPKASL